MNHHFLLPRQCLDCLYQSFSFKKSLIAGIIISLAFYYNFEIGAPIFTAYVTTIILDFFMRTYYKTSLSSPTRFAGASARRARSGIFKIPPMDIGGMTKRGFATNFSLLNILFLFLSILGLGGLISFLTLIRSGSFPNWYSLVTPLLFYSKGFFDIPMPIIGAYYLPLSIYILTFYLILFKLLRRNYKDIHLLCFLLIYGVTSFIYYLGFNVPDHLLTVIHPSLILILIYCWWLYKNHHFFNSLSAIYKTIFITLAIIYLGFSVWPPHN